jgi:hypothetical protein
VFSFIGQEWTLDAATLDLLRKALGAREAATRKVAAEVAEWLKASALRQSSSRL